MQFKSIATRMGGLLIVALSVFALIAALLNPGVRSAELVLDDGGVWVTHGKNRLVAHLNYSAQTFDSALRMSAKNFDVFQNGDDVHASDEEASTLTKIDVVRTALETPVAHDALDTTLNKDTVAFWSGEHGKVWRQNTNDLHVISIEDDTPAISSVPQPHVVVGTDGSIHAVSALNATLVTSGPNDTEESAQRRELPNITAETELQITAVGEQPIVLNRTAHLLYLPNGNTVQLDNATHAQLQVPSVDTGHVLVSTQAGLLSVDLNSGEITTKEAPVSGGVPVQPVQMRQCAYSAWMGTGAFLRDCINDDQDEELTIDTLARSSQALFRVNRNIIVLNDVETGQLWLPDDKMLLVDDWDQVESTIQSEEEDEDDESPSQDTETAQPEQREENTPPVANNDTFGVRANRANPLPVLSNDTDADGDYLIVSNVSKSKLGDISVSRDGAALSIRVPQGVTGSDTVEYEINDGRGGTARATITINVHPDDVNLPPEQIAATSVSLGTGRTASVNALDSWYDPDGDPYYLADVGAPEGLSARFRETGTVDIKETGHGAGNATVTLHVSDGRDIGEGKISVSIKEEGNLAPMTNADHVLVAVGETYTLLPLANDTDPNGDALRLVQVDSGSGGVTATMDGNTGTATITGHVAGTYYLGYVATDGPEIVKGFIRVDVIEQNGNTAPSAEDDLAVLPNADHVLVDLLANDYDPAGGVLTVESIDIPENSALQVALLEHHIARITAPRGLSALTTFTYTVSNGTQRAQATVTVIPTDRKFDTGTPELSDDILVVRVGDVSSVPVLANDRSPAGHKLTVSPELQHDLPADVGSVFISDNVIRVRGGNTPGTGNIVYTVHDSAGNIASATVKVTVVARDDAANTAPVPRPLTARTIAGQRVYIPVPLDGIDREGDGVTLQGLASSPQLGTVEVTTNGLIYTAGEQSVGTDTFTYSVEDTLGKRGIGTVRVGIAPAVNKNQAPVAVPDQVLVRPGKRVSVPVLTNDVDPDADAINLVKDSLASDTPEILQGQRGNDVLLQAPTTEGSYVVTYVIADAKGAQATGLLTVIVRNDAPLQAPIARDDSLSEEQTLEALREGTITLNVRENDTDPDGDITEVAITSRDTTMTINDNGQALIKLLERPQVLIYTITDTDGLSASATVRVPALNRERPSLDLSARLIRVRAGERIDIPINDYIVSRDGREVLIASTSSVTAGIGADGSALVKDRSTLTFQSLPDFSGRTSITMEVTDARGMNDTTAVTSIVTLPIEVEGIVNRPPTLRPAPVSVQRGGEPISVDLAPAASDPDEADKDTLRFALTDASIDGITASLSGTVLTVAATENSRVGNVGELTVSVTDSAGNTVSAPVAVTVQASPPDPKIQVSDAQISLNAGESTTIDITRYATRPTPKKTLSIAGSPRATNGALVSISGTQLTITAPSGYNGNFTVTYAVTDDPNEAERQTVGHINVSVLDKPGMPTGVRATALSATSVQVSWESGSNGGTPITGFTVRDHAQGDFIQCGLVTTCLISGRTTGVEHSFTVQAHNSVGDSEESAAVSVTLDTVPEAPQGVTLAAGDRVATVSWVASVSKGSPVTSYEIELSPGITTVAAPNGTGIQTVQLSGLVNGTEYVARVRAVNAQGMSTWSDPSRVSVPYGVPAPVSGVTATVANAPEGIQGTASVTVSWVPGANNGRPVEYFTVSGGGVTQQVPANQGNSVTLHSVPVSDSQVTFSVTATNDESRASTYTSAPATASSWIVGRPKAPIISSVNATGQDGEVSLHWSASPAGSGWTPGDLSYEWNAGGSWQRLTSNTISGHGLQNGQPATISVRAIGNKTGSVVYSDTVTSASVIPYGPPSTPTISCRGMVTQVRCEWSAGDGNGRPVRYELTGAVNEPVQSGGFRTVSAGVNTLVEMCINVIQDESERRSQACASARALPEPRHVPGNIKIRSVDGLNVTIETNNFDEGPTLIACWNSETRHGVVWNDPITGDPGNTLGGSSGAIFIPSNGIVLFRCSGNPMQPSMAPNEDFSLHLITGDVWVRP